MKKKTISDSQRKVKRFKHQIDVLLEAARSQDKKSYYKFKIVKKSMTGESKDNLYDIDLDHIIEKYDEILESSDSTKYVINGDIDSKKRKLEELYSAEDLDSDGKDSCDYKCFSCQNADQGQLFGPNRCSHQFCLSCLPRMFGNNVTPLESTTGRPRCIICDTVYNEEDFREDRLFMDKHWSRKECQTFCELLKESSKGTTDIEEFVGLICEIFELVWKKGVVKNDEVFYAMVHNRDVTRKEQAEIMRRRCYLGLMVLSNMDILSHCISRTNNKHDGIVDWPEFYFIPPQNDIDAFNLLREVDGLVNQKCIEDKIGIKIKKQIFLAYSARNHPILSNDLKNCLNGVL